MKIRACERFESVGFRRFNRGDVADVPDERSKEFRMLAKRGTVEILCVSAPEASPSPVALDDAEIARLEAELAALERGETATPELSEPETLAPTNPKAHRAAPCVHCGKFYLEHRKKGAPDTAVACGGKRQKFEAAKAEPA